VTAALAANAIAPGAPIPGSAHHKRTAWYMASMLHCVTGHLRRSHLRHPDDANGGPRQSTIRRYEAAELTWSARSSPLLLDGTNRLVQCHRNIVIADPELMVSANPSGLDGIEFVEYSTARPLVLGHVLELMGF
jgi:hypothetical protein